MGASPRQQQNDLSLTDLVRAMDHFVATKGWYENRSKRPQTPRNLATSLAVEAAELLECFQWGDQADPSRLADELADVVLYACQLAGVTRTNLAQAVLAKLATNYSRSWDGISTQAG